MCGNRWAVGFMTLERDRSTEQKARKAIWGLSLVAVKDRYTVQYIVFCIDFDRYILDKGLAE